MSYLPSNCFRIVPIQQGHTPPDRKRVISELVRMNGLLQGVEVRDQPHFSIQYFKQNGKINMFMHILRDPGQIIENRIRQALCEDMGEYRLIEESPSFPEENLRVFAIEGHHHLAIDLDKPSRFKEVFHFADPFLVSLAVKEVEDQTKKRLELKKELLGWKAKAWHYSKMGARAVIDFLLEDKTKVRFEEVMKQIQKRWPKKKEPELPFTFRKLSSDKNRFMEVQVLFLIWTEKEEHVKRFQAKLEKWLKKREGENSLKVVEVRPDLSKVQKGRIQPELPTLCLYQAELNQFLMLPSSEDFDFYFEKSLKTQIPKMMLKEGFALAHSPRGIVSLVRGDSEEEKDSLSTPMMVVGKQGAGKSTLFINMALEFFAVQAKNREEWKRIARSVFLFDVADGAMISETLAHVPEWLRERVVILNHADMNRVIPVAWHDLMDLYQDDDSISAEIAEIQTELLKKFLQDDNQTISIERYFKSALQASYRVGEGNLLDAIRILKDGDYRKELLERLSETDFELEIALNQLEEETEKEYSRVLETIENRIAQLRTNKQIFYSLSQLKDESIDFWKWMNEPYLVLIHIPNSKETFQGFAFTHYIVKLWRLMMAREMIPKPERRECVVIVDEIDLIIKNKSVQNIFLQMTKKPRKYRMKFIFSFHDWSSFAKAGNFKNDILRSFKTGMDLILFRGSHEVFKDFQSELEPFTVEDFYRLEKYQGIFRITCNKKEYVFQAKLLEPASRRLSSYPVPDLRNQLGMTREEIIKRAREILLPLYQKESKSSQEESGTGTARDKLVMLLRKTPEGLTTQEICEALDIRRETFQRIKRDLKIHSRRDGKKLVHYL